MRYRKLTPDGDYSFGGGQLDFWRDVPDAVAQAVQTRLLLWLGEWFLNIEDGTPYMVSILGKHSQADADATIQDRILNTQGIVDIAVYSSSVDPNTRIMAVPNITVNTIYGPTQIQIANYTNF